ncbi:MAG: M15 family metallopeptidase [Bacteroidales bacterium]|nr:M15 family metallopeptidase [Bacteroidales bacterium]
MKKVTRIVFLILLTFSVAACSDNESETAEEVFNPGEIVPEQAIISQGETSFFKDTEIPNSIFALMQGKSFKQDCTVPRSDLRYLLCLHRDINGHAIVGEMVVNKKISSTVLNILRQLYKANYPIERMRLVDYWDADDEMSMRDNNSSSFNFRFISHTTTVSKHGKGTAIDINTLYNPYHKILEDGTEIIEPATGAEYLDRSKSFPYKIEKDDLCYKLFTENGFEWGGDWTTRKDYQHFELIEEE